MDRSSIFFSLFLIAVEGKGLGTRALDSLGQGNILRSVASDKWGRVFKKRSLDTLGQSNVLRFTNEHKRSLDSLGMGNILRSLDKRSREAPDYPWTVLEVGRSAAYRPPLDTLGRGNILRMRMQ